ncbi:MAG TPA: hypothetical protein VF200_01270 [Woeseiaceae bacterium]
MKAPLLLVIAVACTGCTVSEVITAEKTPLEVASMKIDESLLLDVGVMNFDPAIPEDNEADESGIYPEVRQAEARYLPYHLKTTLQGTGFWGAVRVIPSEYAFTDVMVSGEIERSDGEFVTLKVKAWDARGQDWFEKSYSMQTGITSYSENRDLSKDPYQKVFNEIANDLRNYAAGLNAKEVRRIRQISEMKFLADMAPTVFGEYITTDEDGITSLVRLPAENDPMVERLRQIRARDQLVIDTLNEHYANFYYGIAIPYESWRETAREQAVNYRQVKRAATLRALLGVVVVAGSMSIDTSSSSRSAARAKTAAQYVGINRGIGTIISSWNLRQSANIYRENIKELSESFGAEAAPLVVRVEGETRRLTGTAEAQYETWRKLLKEIYRAETGFAQALEVGVEGRAQAESPR